VGGKGNGRRIPLHKGAKKKGGKKRGTVAAATPERGGLQPVNRKNEGRCGPRFPKVQVSSAARLRRKKKRERPRPEDRKEEGKKRFRSGPPCETVPESSRSPRKRAPVRCERGTDSPLKRENHSRSEQSTSGPEWKREGPRQFREKGDNPPFRATGSTSGGDRRSEGGEEKDLFEVRQKNLGDQGGQIEEGEQDSRTLRRNGLNFPP